MSFRWNLSPRFILISLLFLAAVAWHGEAEAAQLTLIWTDNSTNEDGFNIERLIGSTYREIATVEANSTSYTETGLTAGTIYCYRNRAVNSAGKSAYSNEACGRSKDPDVDTDGDGLSDGEEVKLGTNSLLADTDGDGLSDGEEVNLGTDPLLADLASNSLPLQAGEVTVDHTWKRVEFSEPFVNPIVVAKPLSFNGSDPAVVRIRHVGPTGFDIRIQEWDYLDGTHTSETVGYIVMERGSFILGDGTLVEANSFETNKTNSFGLVPFNQLFNTVPVVLTAVSSFNGSDTVTSRVRNISTEDFEFGMQEQEGNSPTHVTESISYIAWEPSAGTINGLTYEVNATRDVMKHKWRRILFNESFIDSPVFLADMQTTDGRDTSALRWKNKDPFGVKVKIEEEQSRDRETAHTTEVVGYIVFAHFSVKIWLEAEEGIVGFPMEVAKNGAASSGRYIWVPKGEGKGGYAEYVFEVPVAGEYVVWGRVISNTWSEDSFFVSVDGGKEALWDTRRGGTETWVWDHVSDRGVADPVIFYLDAGVHTLVIKRRERGTKIDKILITNDLNYSPQGSGE